MHILYTAFFNTIVLYCINNAPKRMHFILKDKVYMYIILISLCIVTQNVCRCVKVRLIHVHYMIVLLNFNTFTCTCF